ncbi:hypothetical protein CDO52_07010 [Nocardiopsis gilva YIM 90087]|uniref:Uncharacterized protein n=1 Tax=Nocardiopsis gilva YIM 90087 TaxID=1235441 RepID=A0A223S361_9ACTN|nr:hypothetical protein [Nocardiopsis gilva]ASU82565.1 hypothetical protein CDO52_07010 [Nocardiopsis gilva YIM 90087]
MYVEECDPECTPGAEFETDEFGGAVTATDSGFVHTGWQEFRYDHGSGKSHYAPHPDSGLYLWECQSAQECDDGDGTQVRSFGGLLYGTYSALTPLGKGLVIVSYVRPDDEKDVKEVSGGDTGGLRADVCKDLACTDPQTVPLPNDITVGSTKLDGPFLDVAAAPGGGFAIAAYDANFGSLNVIACADSECAEPKVTPVVGDQFRREYQERLRSRFGARIEYRPDGTPVLAYRDAKSGGAHVVNCHDSACTDFTDRAITGPGWARPVPGLAVDSHGNPQLVTFDMVNERLVLMSCLDGDCADAITTPLRGFTEVPAVSALGLDSEDRPHIVWGQIEDAPLATRTSAEYLRCAEALCGAQSDPIVDSE